MTHRLIEELNLAPHPEGGHYREDYRSECTTSIFFLLLAGEHSRWHRLPKRELWQVLDGELRLYVLGKAGELRCNLLSVSDPVCTVLSGEWQAAEPVGEFAVCRCTVSPPFLPSDLEFGVAGQLAKQFPGHDDLIARLC